MTRSLTAILLLALALGSTACRTGNADADSNSKGEGGEVEPTTAPPAKKSAAEVLRLADDRVEEARLQALPLEPLRPEVIQGFALPLYAELPSLSYEQMLASVRSAGASHVSIVVSWDQRTIYANTIRPNPDKGPPDARVGEVISAAHDQGLSVMLFPIIHVKLRNEGEWRGKMAPEDLDRWKAEYRDFILHYAEIAQRHDVEIYSVGSELGTLEKEEEFWRGLIADARETYDGKLLYSANWDHYTKPKFWDALDYIGVSSYFEIAREENDTVDEMVGRWRKFRDDMLAFADENGRPLLMTEVGYPSMPSAATKPWDYTRKEDPRMNAQLAAFRALSQTWTLQGEDADLFAGLFIWHAWGSGGAADRTYTVWNKPSERFILRWYAR